MTSDEIEWYATHFDHLAAMYNAERNQDDAARWSQAAAMMRRLRDERDEARNKALDEAANKIDEMAYAITCPEEAAGLVRSLKKALATPARILRMEASDDK